MVAPSPAEVPREVPVARRRRTCCSTGTPRCLLGCIERNRCGVRNELACRPSLSLDRSARSRSPQPHSGCCGRPVGHRERSGSSSIGHRRDAGTVRKSPPRRTTDRPSRKAHDLRARSRRRPHRSGVGHIGQEHSEIPRDLTSRWRGTNSPARVTFPPTETLGATFSCRCGYRVFPPRLAYELDACPGPGSPSPPIKGVTQTLPPCSTNIPTRHRSGPHPLAQPRRPRHRGKRPHPLRQSPQGIRSRCNQP